MAGCKLTRYTDFLRDERLRRHFLPIALDSPHPTPPWSCHVNDVGSVASWHAELVGADTERDPAGARSIDTCRVNYIRGDY